MGRSGVEPFLHLMAIVALFMFWGGATLGSNGIQFNGISIDCLNSYLGYLV